MCKDKLKKGGSCDCGCKDSSYDRVYSYLEGGGPGPSKYSIKKGDTLSGIAKEKGVSLNELLQTSGNEGFRENPNYILPGQEIFFNGSPSQNEGKKEEAVRKVTKPVSPLKDENIFTTPSSGDSGQGPLKIEEAEVNNEESDWYGWGADNTSPSQEDIYTSPSIIKAEEGVSKLTENKKASVESLKKVIKNPEFIKKAEERGVSLEGVTDAEEIKGRIKVVMESSFSDEPELEVSDFIRRYSGEDADEVSYLNGESTSTFQLPFQENYEPLDDDMVVDITNPKKPIEAPEEQDTEEEGVESTGFSGEGLPLFLDPNASLEDWNKELQKNTVTSQNTQEDDKAKGALLPKLPQDVIRGKANYEALDFLVDTRKKDKYGDSVELLSLSDKIYTSIPEKTSDGSGVASCLGSTKDCSLNFINPAFKGYGAKNLRAILDLEDEEVISKYLIESSVLDKNDEFVFKKNFSLDTWEVHDYLRGEKKGYNPFEGKKLEFDSESGSPLPSNVTLEELSSLPIGTLIGQGSSAEAEYTLGKDDEGRGVARNRHSLIVTGYDYDGMPLVYSLGAVSRLDEVGNGLGNITMFTVPNENKGLDYQWALENKRKVDEDYNFNYEDMEFDEDLAPTKEIAEAVGSVEKGVNSEPVKRISMKKKISKQAREAIFKLMPGLANRESKLGGTEGITDYSASDNTLGITLGGVTAARIFTEGLKENWDYAKGLVTRTSLPKEGVLSEESLKRLPPQSWERNIKALEMAGGDKKLRDKILSTYNKVKGLWKDFNPSSVYERVEDRFNTTPSKGVFKIKETREQTKALGIKEEDLYANDKGLQEEIYLGTIAAYDVLTDNYIAIKDKWEESLTEQQMVKMAFATYSNSTKFDKEYLINYIKDGATEKDDSLQKILDYSYKSKDRQTNEGTAEQWGDYIDYQKSLNNNNK